MIVEMKTEVAAEKDRLRTTAIESCKVSRWKHFSLSVGNHVVKEYPAIIDKQK